MLEKIYKIARNVVKILIRTLAVTLLLVATIFIVNVNNVMNDLDLKTDVIARAISDYYKLVVERTTAPDFAHLVKTNVLILNQTQGCGGSGTMININGKNIVISAGHLVTEVTDSLVIVEKGKYRPIRLTKINHAVDLAEFEYIDNYTDIASAKLASDAPTVGEKIWAIGNPAMLEDAITSGVVVRLMEIYYMIDAKIYYGSSGGGLFNNKGELVGVNVAMTGTGTYMLGLSVKLEVIKAFIAGRIDSEI